MSAICKLRLELENKSELDLNYNMSSLFHGALMELLDNEYVDSIHIQGIRPYSQHIEIKGDNVYWTINALNEQAEENIIKRLNTDELKSITLKKKNILLNITKKELVKSSYEELIQSKYFGESSSRIVNIKFNTPIAFKSNGKYVFYPSIKNIYRSLMKKYDSNNEKVSVFDKDVIDELEKNTNIIKYNLRSTNFHLEGVKIPAFLGEITVKITGSMTLVNLANLLFYYGEYCGVGIKSAIGMGAMSIIQKNSLNAIEEKIKKVVEI